MMSDFNLLPPEVDVFVLGTGLPESIIAAACSKAGLTVLHVDRNGYYGGIYSSFHFDGLNEWMETQESTKEFDQSTIDSTLLNENEQILLSRGPMVDLLCQSEVAKYCEFKCIDRLLHCVDGQTMDSGNPVMNFQIVPCSRADIFQSEVLSVMEKRRIMKFFNSCMEWQENDKEIRDCMDQPFDVFLESHGVSGNLKTMTADAIGILQTDSTTKEGLDAVFRFMQSVGRYGNSPFLWTMFGSGDLAQCFSRKCAVFGGTYCLKRKVEGFVISNEKVVAVISENQRINCKYLIIDPTYLPEQFLKKPEENNAIQRAIIISDKSVLPQDQEHVLLLLL
ncbi:unnamed protein product [Dracunculus medinensis]|uniref:Rab proteins geranylgeranyltransferase component A n=1 Tax=Dracunculus medinensis TaxID=318479 RepID=A0A3P7Q8I2_DRAME|nr:unnamed protein product [Dracunculus medinensis]